jgi:hypothetical protein
LVWAVFLFLNLALTLPLEITETFAEGLAFENALNAETARGGQIK